jgi:hypothetical protein
VKDEQNGDKVRVVQEKLSELHTAEPLECGVPRQAGCISDFVTSSLQIFALARWN